MQKLFIVFFSIFFVFILWVIYLANTGQHNGLFKLTTAIPYGDKIGHFFLFGLLAFLANLSVKCRCFSFGKFSVYWGSFIVLVFVSVEELSQHFLPTRTLDIYDYGADIIGISCATFLSWLFKSILFKKDKEHYK